VNKIKEPTRVIEDFYKACASFISNFEHGLTVLETGLNGKLRNISETANLEPSTS
jgi:hypothetical protein